ncbi:MAG: toll/interleukin-1 receptor domain-containing protein, partial [Chloroflexota bacterium]
DLARAIDEAEIFQLFWSDNSADSKYCRFEWEYAMEHKCPDNKCESFIRPVYWRKPMPKPPKELMHLNFKFVNFNEEQIALIKQIRKNITLIFLLIFLVAIVFLISLMVVTTVSNNA